MSIIFVAGAQRSDLYHPMYWRETMEPFPAFRGRGQNRNHIAFLPFSRNYKPKINEYRLENDRKPLDYIYAEDTNYSKLITTKRGNLLLVPTTMEENEYLCLATFTSDYHGFYSSIKLKDAEIVKQWSSTGYFIHVCHLIIRFTSMTGYVAAESNIRSGVGIVDVVTLDSYAEMTTDEFEVWSSEKKYC